MKHIALITGATSGIGEACAKRFAAEGIATLILTGRRQERLQALCQSLEAEYGTRCLPLHFDIRDRAAVRAAWESLPKADQQVDILVNNAGLALGKSAIQ